MALTEDPEAAFRVRMRQDRARILRLARRLRGQGAWTAIAPPLARLEQLAHGLAGVSGVFGHAGLGEAAGRVERLLERWRQEAPPCLSPRRRALLAAAIARLTAALRTAERGSTLPEV